MDPAHTKFSGFGDIPPYYASDHNGAFVPYGDIPPYYQRGSVPYSGMGDYVQLPYSGYGADPAGCSILTLLTTAAIGFVIGLQFGTHKERGLLYEAMQKKLM